MARRTPKASKRHTTKKPVQPTNEGGPMTFLEKIDLYVGKALKTELQKIDLALSASFENHATELKFQMRILLSEDEFGLQEEDFGGELYQMELKKFREERWLEKQLEGLGLGNS